MSFHKWLDGNVSYSPFHVNVHVSQNLCKNLQNLKRFGVTSCCYHWLKFSIGDDILPH